jgi:hypothetical protein
MDSAFHCAFSVLSGDFMLDNEYRPAHFHSMIKDWLHNALSTNFSAL